MSGTPTSLRSRLAKNFGFLAMARFGRALTPIVLTPLFLKVWGTEKYGDWIAVCSIPAAIMIFQDGGISSSLANVMGGLHPDDEENASELQTLAFQGSAAAALLILLACSCLGVFLLLKLTLNTFGTTESIICFGLVSFSSVLSLITNSFLGYFRYRGIESSFLRSVGIATLSEIIVAIVVLLMIPQPVVVAGGLMLIRVSLCCWAFRQTISLKWLRRAIRFPSIASYRPYISSSLGFAGLPLVVVAQNQAIYLLIHAAFGASLASAYQITKTYANAIQLVAGTLYLSLLPELPRLWAFGEIGTVSKLCWKSLQLTALGSIVLATLLWFLGPPVFRVWTLGVVAFPAVIGGILITGAAVTSILNCATALPRAANQVHRLLLPFLTLNLTALLIAYLGRNWFSISEICGVMLIAEGICCGFTIFLFREMIRSRDPEKGLPVSSVALPQASSQELI